MRTLAVLASLTLLAACSPRPLNEIDEIYSNDPARRVLCGINIDDKSEIPLDSIQGGVDRAHANGEVLHIYAHMPGVTVNVDRIKALLDFADQAGLAYVTYNQLGQAAPAQGALALAFDDSDIDGWYGLKDLFASHGARVTFFVTRYDLWTDADRAKLHELAALGHDIEAHGLRHLNGPSYVTEYGLEAYMNDEVLPSIDLLRADGFSPTVYAYPFGRRTGETDDAILKYVDRVRSVSFAHDVLISDPCPE